MKNLQVKKIRVWPRLLLAPGLLLTKPRILVCLRLRYSESSPLSLLSQHPYIL